MLSPWKLHGDSLFLGALLYFSYGFSPLWSREGIGRKRRKLPEKRESVWRHDGVSMEIP